MLTLTNVSDHLAEIVKTWKRVWSEDECTRQLDGHESMSDACVKLFQCERKQLERFIYVNLCDSMIDICELPSGKHVAFWTVYDGDQIWVEQ